MYPYIQITETFKIPTYGVWAVLGIIAASIVAVVFCKKRNLSIDALMSITLAAGVGLFIGAHLLYGITNIHNIAGAFANYGSYPNFWAFIGDVFSYFNGMVFFGGLYGGILGGFIWAKHKKYPIGDFGDLFAVVTPLFHAFGRVGCLFAGCCYGVEASWGVSGRVGDIPPEMTRVPIQLFEAGVLLLIAAFAAVFFVKGKARGSLFPIYMAVYAVARFILEFFRGDEIRGRLWIFSTSQWISLITLVLVAVYFIVKLRKSEKASA